ncbi:MAG: VOC family protein [Verrucomicrobia bacterium]|nr:VOC family protein [Verrucomicrobiota bacterium]
MQFAVEHLGLPARDPAALADWYVRTLDATLTYTDGKTPPAFFVRLPGGGLLEIYPAHATNPETANNKLAGWRHVALRVDSIAAAKSLLESRGVKFTKEIDSAFAGGRVLYFADAEGNLLHLVERPADWRLK